MADEAPKVRGDIATRFQPGVSGNPRRGPDRRPRRLVRNMLVAALAAEGPIMVEVQGKRGGIRKKTFWGRQAAAHSLLVAVQQIARQAQRNPNAVIRLLELIAQEVDGRPMAGTDTGYRRATYFIFEGEQPAPPGHAGQGDSPAPQEPRFRPEGDRKLPREGISSWPWPQEARAFRRYSRANRGR